MSAALWDFVGSFALCFLVFAAVFGLAKAAEWLLDRWTSPLTPRGKKGGRS